MVFQDHSTHSALRSPLDPDLLLGGRVIELENMQLFPQYKLMFFFFFIMALAENAETIDLFSYVLQRFF